MNKRTYMGFSLVEILVSISIMAFLLTVGTQAFVQVRTFTKRMQAKQTMHNSARVIFEQLRNNVSSLEQSAAMYLVSHNGSGLEPKGIELVFLRGKLDHLDFTRKENFGDYSVGVTDLVWSRWSWDAATKAFKTSASSPNRMFQLGTSWTNGGIDYKNQYFANLPCPRRVAGIGPAVLNENAYGTGDLRDIGDYQDLLNNAVPLATTCTNLRIELVLHDGTTVNVDGSSNVVYAYDGVLVDASLSPALSKRPRLVRMLIELTDTTSHLVETFSFTVQAPGLLPL